MSKCKCDSSKPVLHRNVVDTTSGICQGCGMQVQRSLLERVERLEKVVEYMKLAPAVHAPSCPCQYADTTTPCSCGVEL